MNTKKKNLVIKSVESILVIGYIFFEELIWNVFAKPIYQYCKSLAVLESLKKTFLNMNRYLLLILFIAILAITEALGFVAGIFIFNGFFYSGTVIYTAKIPIAAFTFWLFELTKDKLMTFLWLKICYGHIMDWIDIFINSTIHVYIKEKINNLRHKMKQLNHLYFGQDGFITSIKKHYTHFKQLVSSTLEKWSVFKN